MADRKGRFTQNKAVRLYDRLGAAFQKREPTFLEDTAIEIKTSGGAKVLGWIKLMSAASMFPANLVNIREGGAKGGTAKGTLRREQHQLLIQIARSHFGDDLGKSKGKSLSFVAKRLQMRVIPAKLKEAEKEDSPDIDALAHLSTLSERQLRRILTEEEKKLAI